MPERRLDVYVMIIASSPELAEMPARTLEARQP
jgi:hypothetical protein